MSTRKGIKDGALFDVFDSGIVYTEVLGWIDKGHKVTLIKFLTASRIILMAWVSLSTTLGQHTSL